MRTKNLISDAPHELTIVGGFHFVYRFDNGYGASVIKCGMSVMLHQDHDKWELAVLKFSGDRSVICYDTEITCDVEKYLTEDEVDDLLDKIERLPVSSEDNPTSPG